MDELDKDFAGRGAAGAAGRAVWTDDDPWLAQDEPPVGPMGVGGRREVLRLHGLGARGVVDPDRVG